MKMMMMIHDGSDDENDEKDGNGVDDDENDWQHLYMERATGYKIPMLMIIDDTYEDDDDNL